ncbi:MAG: NAD(P)-dependent oxidoreductase [Burkholderiales bacterium]|nr:NAD(P)-dependent oxidoreductase [Burkholderiales bacterium]
MGTAVARRLIETGHEVAVWNRSPENAREAREAGARWNARLCDLVNESDVVISFLLDNAAVERVYLGPRGILNGRVEGRLFIDMSTVSPGTHLHVAAALSQRSAGFIECPVSGSIAAVRSGTLVGFAGGEAADFARAQPVLADLCRRVEHVGPLGAGARMKLAANLLLVVFWQALGESLLLAGPHGVDAARAIDLLADSNIGAGILRARGSQIVAAMKGNADGAPAAFDVDTMLKDLRYMADEAAAQGKSLPLASRTLECFDRASRDGGGGVDGAAYPAYWVAHQRATTALSTRTKH